MTLQELFLEGKETLYEAQIQEWELDAWYLLEYVTGMTRSRYFLDPHVLVGQKDREDYQKLLKKRAAHVPLQYLTGVQEFMGCSFLVSEQVLIPRQDTEILVEEAAARLCPGMEILDLCTGSGCILLSLLKLVKGVKGNGNDLSSVALCVAAKNKERLGVQAEFLQSDLFEQVKGRYDCILSNPPYIPSGTIDSLMEEVRDHEPRMALDGREDGLYYYREIISKSPGYLKPEGMLFLEIGYDQAEAVTKMMEPDFKDVRVKKDLAGLDRVVYGCLK
ncbi:MAG: peptide chain release factor N(5)-glutamine methyltransferase [Lachnospiraceae bacterium]|nr:peptide chain release factor N(5)-glutamine methyltransferase [Lachnospiraceae bacterium]